ncbi:MAG: hypothetical protein KIT25_09525 [Enhydrobacter sp.]|nr:MAG: hypothetical protein KIT25_09525 [Enhydrobacter sp.]
MPIFMEVDRLNQTVTIVAHGVVSNEDIERNTRELVDAKVPQFAKIIDTSAATSRLTPQQVEHIASMLRSEPGPRGPVAYVINANRVGFAHAHADVTRSERPIKLFTSLHEARRWIAQVRKEAEGIPAGLRAAEALSEDRSHLRPVDENARDRRRG